MSKTVTHFTTPNPDLDALVALALLGADPDEVAFVTAKARRVPQKADGAKGIGHPLGLKTERTGRGCVTNQLDEAKDLPARLLMDVNERTTRGRLGRPLFDIGTAFYAMKEGFRSYGLGGRDLDREMLRFATVFVEGAKSLEKKRQEAAGWCQANVHTERIGGFEFAWTEDEVEIPVQAGLYLNEAVCVHATIFQGPGTALGIARNPQFEEAPDLCLLRPHIPDTWFTHPDGILTAWGSRKGQTEGEPRPLPGPQTATDILTILHTVYGE